MANEDQKPAPFPPAGGQGQQGDRQKPPTPPPPEIAIRTMRSDLESLRQTGGISPSPKTFTAPQPQQEEKGADLQKPSAPPLPKPSAPPPPPMPATPPKPSTPPSPPMPPKPTQGIPSMPPRPEPLPRPEKPLPGPTQKPEMSSPARPPFPPKITPAEFDEPKEKKKEGAQEPEFSEMEEEKGGFNWKKLIMWALAVAIIVGVGLLGYFVVFPLFFSTEPSLPPPPAVTLPPEQEEELPGPPAEPVIREHQSLLGASDATITTSLPAINLSALKNALLEASQETRPTGTLLEVILAGDEGQVAASEALSALLPDASPTLPTIFEEDFTTAIYFDENGAWPAYIFKLNLGFSIVEGQAETTALEQSASLSNFFLTPPGTPSAAGFRNGQAQGLPTRYLTYSQQGAALNFTWSDDTFVVSTSYNGLQKILQNLR